MNYYLLCIKLWINNESITVCTSVNVIITSAYEYTCVYVCTYVCTCDTMVVDTLLIVTETYMYNLPPFVHCKSLAYFTLYNVSYITYTYYILYINKYVYIYCMCVCMRVQGCVCVMCACIDFSFSMICHLLWLVAVSFSNTAPAEGPIVFRVVSKNRSTLCSPLLHF